MGIFELVSRMRESLQNPFRQGLDLAAFIETGANVTENGFQKVVRGFCPALDVGEFRVELLEEVVEPGARLRSFGQPWATPRPSAMTSQ